MIRTPMLLIAATLLSGLQGAASSPDPFILAVVRDDGVILPVAAHDRGRWRTPWPGPAKVAEVPVRLDDCPLAWWGLDAPPTTWTLHAGGEASREIHTDGLTWVPSYCRQQVVVFSRQATRALPRPADGFRVPKQGVAVTAPVDVRLPRDVALDGTEARALLDVLQPAFNHEERMMLAGDWMTVMLSVGADERDRQPIVALSIHDIPDRSGIPRYFVELMRAYPRTRGPRDLRWCDEVTYMAGWVRRRRDDAIDLTLVTRGVTSCLIDTVQRAVPLAVVHADGDPVWVLEMTRPNSETIGIFRAPSGDAPEFLAGRPLGLCER